ncbi:polysaccharide deacetylase family protein [Sphingomonas psychrotolerans]|uniref:Polysaccharide deacetylase family protein n=1 Tax=Sphingomonas psychrotolerans TaxID=1327635 RepID=A0ABU3MZL0_9SPHN|nr:polysaccharide deacetylase family protein [Sphingomonas psychrotolerans]MDT8757739.1 polysaccharide deacetylase family protein [Sphingomonas psychrotolerans]
MPPAATSGALVQWPDSFGTRFTLFVDTEEEFDWGAPFSRDAGGTSHMTAMPQAHARFAAHGVPLTWLVDYPIATCPRAVEILRGLIGDGRSSIGTQLHPWVNPPFEEEISTRNSFAGNLPGALEERKLTTLTEVIVAAFGVRPAIYRAGRYGVGPDTFATLARLGYRADSSMRVAYDYSQEGGPNFSLVANHAFRTGPAESIVELPLTTVFTGALRRGGAHLHRALGRVPRGRGVAARLRLLSRVALTPEDMPLGEAREAVRVAVGEGVRLLNFSFHSPSVAPGHTPYVRDAADLAAFWRWWDAMFGTLAQLGAAPASLAEILDAACGTAPSSASAAGAGGL